VINFEIDVKYQSKRELRPIHIKILTKFVNTVRGRRRLILAWLLESTSQTASQSIQQFLRAHGRDHETGRQTDRQTDRHTTLREDMHRSRPHVLRPNYARRRYRCVGRVISGVHWPWGQTVKGQGHSVTKCAVSVGMHVNMTA